MNGKTGLPLFLSVIFLAVFLLHGTAKPQTERTTGKPDQIRQKVETQAAVPRLIAHAGGEFLGIRLTNSLQALNNSYEKGFRYFEVDMNWTRDHVPVLVHDWGNVNWFLQVRHSTEPQLFLDFIQSRTITGMRMMDLDSLETWCSVHLDAKIVSDGKSENVALLERIKEKCPNLFSALIPQAYSFEEYSEVKKLGYTKVMLSLYRLEKERSDVVSFCRSNSLFGVAIYESNATNDLLNEIGNVGVKTFIHTVNDYNQYVKFREDGAYGVFTDFLQPGSWVE